ncbi:MAG: hypothetical protein LBB05_02255 [Puniceicoccales bacterium]|nr:hypothetical protein [Puniceicoccales bacterium]
MNTNIQKIVRLGLLVGVPFNAIAHSAQELAEALCKLRSADITVGNVYTAVDVYRVWHADFISLARNVVRINVLEVQNELSLPYIGTGTLVDIGIPELAGRVVITCKHCSFSNGDPNGKDILQLLGVKYSENAEFGISGEFDVGGKTYLSVTPECEHSQEPKPLINTVPDHLETLSNERAIAVRSVYNLNAKDFGVMILEKPVKLNGQIVSGFPLGKLNVMNSLNVIDTKIGNHINTPQPSTVIGYGLTGVPGALGSVGFLEYAVKNNKLKERQALFMELGWNVKKAIQLRGIDGGYALQGCACKQYDSGNDLQYAYPMAGGGFSGSLVVIKGAQGGYDVVGIFSGPLWTEELKNCVRSIGDHAKGIENPTPPSQP